MLNVNTPVAKLLGSIDKPATKGLMTSHELKSIQGARTLRLTKTSTPHANEIPELTAVSSYDYHRIA